MVEFVRQHDYPQILRKVQIENLQDNIKELNIIAIEIFFKQSQFHNITFKYMSIWKCSKVSCKIFKIYS